MALARPLPHGCLIGDGSAMSSIQALWTAAQRKLPLTVVVINNLGYGDALVQPGDAVRNVPGLDLPGIDFPVGARHGLRRGARHRFGGAGARATARPGA